MSVKSVNHHNFYDEKGRVFCKKQSKVVDLDYDKCDKCEYCVGSLQGVGVECQWDDSVNAPVGIHEVRDANAELLRVSKLIDSGILKKG